ncbi:LysM peptidoglycan-binding domain-containing protein [Paenibacillus barcinonensis]|uniref:LysM peptidoglycan-binding domain-containing protein n=1 Tax=Paenibacillus barcinonensis TaxID=198119 RepID=A0A2V4W9V9_PAEBA|nr:LysM peptidoglycan-binding domain-containing protein [Paenibacillus barcinonensis]PYE44424.1 morphogenetic protein associated with SpoVID [Paenibacillus barcinonensis]QKS56766.1 LysM peptidoglycan-binding domain-containing protein [Paenibacillus barcinonensis]
MKIHMVKKGDTLYLLSQKYNVALDTLIAANPQIADPDKLDIGMKVKIPTQPVTPKPEGVLHSHKVIQGDSLWKLSQAWGVPLKDMINANPQLKNPNALLVGETVYIPSMHTQASNSANTEMGNMGMQEKLSPQGKEYTGVKEETAPVAPPPPAVVETPVPAPVVPAKPNVMPELEVLPQLPEMPEMKPEKKMDKKEEKQPEVQVKPVAEAKKPQLPNPSPNMMPLPVMPETKSPVDIAPSTKAPCGCGSKMLHAPMEHPYVQVPVPAQEVYSVQQNNMYTAGVSNNSPFPGIQDVGSYSIGNMPNSPWTGDEQTHNHNNVMPNLSAGASNTNNAFPISPAGQPPFVSPYSMLPYPPCGCGSHTHAPQYTYPAYGYQEPVWGMYGHVNGMPPEMSTSVMPNQPMEYAYQNPYPAQNMVPPSPLGAFGEMYPSQVHGAKNGKKGGRDDANLSQAAFEEADSEAGSKPKSLSGKSGAVKRKATKAVSKNKSKVSVSGNGSREKSAAASNQRKVAKKRRNPWIQS